MLLPTLARPRRIATATLPVLAALLGGCLKGEEDPNGTEVENELSGRLYYADGKPAAGARVRLFPVGQRPDSTGVNPVAFSALTDAAGRYVLTDSLARGEYNILGEKDDQLSYQDSVFIAGRRGTLPPDTLEGPGSVAGFVGLEPQDRHNLRSVTVQVLGTHVFVNAGADGRFVLPRLAEGEYTVRLETSLSEYAPRLASLAVRSGVAAELADTLYLPFTGIPAVTGLRAAYDTVSATARLAWRPSPHANLKEYLVYRSVEGDLSLSKELVARTRDTTFSEPLFLPAPGGYQGVDPSVIEPDAYPHGKPRSYPYVYTVVVRTRTEILGPVFEEARVDAVAPSAAKTYMDFAFRGAVVGVRTVSVGDTVKVVVNWYNRTRTNASLRWLRPGVESPLRERAVTGNSGSDTLVHVAGGAEERTVFRVEVTDAAGDVWTEETHLEVVRDAPRADAGKDLTVHRGQAASLAGTARQDFGAILKWEWDLGAKGSFEESPDGKAAFIPPANSSRILCILRVTDDDGQVGLDSVQVTVSHSRFLAPMPTPRAHFTLLEAGGKLYALGGQRPRKLSIGSTVWDDLRTFESFDPATGAWRTHPEMPANASNQAAAAVGGRIHLLASDGINYHAIYTFDPASETWTRRSIPDAGQPGKYRLLGAVGGRLVLLFRGWNRVSYLFEYDPAADRWEEKTWGADPLQLRWTWNENWNLRSVELDGKLLITFVDPTMRVLEYDPTTSGFSLHGGGSDNIFQLGRPGMSVWQGKVLIAGGHVYGRGITAYLSVSDPAKGWRVELLPDLAIPRNSPAVAVVGGVLYVAGGFVIGQEAPTDAFEEYEF